MNKDIIDALNKGKDYRWIIKDEDKKSFSISKRVFYLANVGTSQGEPENTLELMRKHVVDRIDNNMLKEEMTFEWETIDEMWRLVRLIFEVK